MSYENHTLSELRALLREKRLMVGYPAAIVSKGIAVDLLERRIGPRAALQRLMDEKPKDHKLQEWIRSNDIPARYQFSGNQQPKGEPQQKAQAQEEKSDELDPRNHENWPVLVQAAKAMNVPLEKALAKYADEYKRRISELETALEKAKKGETFEDPDNWGVDPNYIPPRIAPSVKRLVEEGKPVYLVGPAGSGKSMLLRWVCQQLQRRMMFISMHEHLLADSLEGYSWLSVQNGATVQEWCEGIVQKALETGSILVVDEFDRAPAALQHMLNDVAQSRSFTLKEGPNAGQKIIAKPGFMILATGNTLNGSDGQFSSTMIDRSTLSRFRVIYVTFDTEVEGKILQRMGVPQASRILRMVQKVRDLYEQGEDVTALIGTRHLIHVAKDVKDGHSLRDAWEWNVSLMQGAPNDPGYKRCQQVLNEVAA